MNKVIVEHLYPDCGGIAELRVFVTEEPEQSLKDYIKEYLENISVDEQIVESILSMDGYDLSEALEEYDITYVESDYVYLPGTESLDAVRYDIVKTYNIDESPVSIEIGQ